MDVSGSQPLSNYGYSLHQKPGHKASHIFFSRAEGVSFSSSSHIVVLDLLAACPCINNEIFLWIPIFKLVGTLTNNQDTPGISARKLDESFTGE